MDSRLLKIVVPKKIAIIAQQKGFDEWCAFYYYQEINNPFANVDNNNDFLFDSEKYDRIPCPTHQQLIDWLNDFGIILRIQTFGCFNITTKDGEYFENYLREFEINKAIELALNLVS